MKIKYLLPLLLVVQIATAQKFDDYFIEGALRVDFLLTGTASSTTPIIYSIKKDKYFGGSQTNLIFPNYGEYYVQIKDAKTGGVIYGKGFNPLFNEWQLIPEAKEVTRAFENSIQLPYPKDKIIFELMRRNKKNNRFETFFAETINPQSYHIVREAPKNYPTRVIQANYPPDKAVDIAVLAEGYTKDEMPKFINDLQRMLDYLFGVEPFKSYKKRFNIYAIESPSEESGTDINGKYIYKNTMLNTHFYTFDSERYLTIPSLFRLADIASLVPYDQLFVIVNTPKYGGGGFYNVVNIASSDGKFAEKVFAHEFGHGFVGLADEYFDDDMLASDNSDYLSIEPWEANITTLVDFDMKWADMITDKTPVPTPRSPQYANSIGVFEGGGYYIEGVYSPMQDCRMKSNVIEHFCPVCIRAIQQAIEFYIK